mmetsp:Transcript_274/g.650  ORF Transcript_274/g.650 Transcript_274/m.650 type:complete len:237 (+) Transcript_274:106-816(+)
MGAGKNKNHRKKRISKHVLEAEQRKKQAEVENHLISAAERRKGSAVTPSDASSAAATKSAGGDQGAIDSEQKSVRPASSLKTKDPEEASSYLSLWNYDRKNSTKQWKFNKNTQSWLLRHMYDSDKVSKATSHLLVEYLCQGGDGLRSRVEEDAKRRARRYKEWEKEQQHQEEAQGGGETETEEEEVKSKDKPTQSSHDEAWNGLDDHDKRKEYKRARKLLDTLKAREKSEENLDQK